MLQRKLSSPLTPFKNSRAKEYYKKWRVKKKKSNGNKLILFNK